MRCENSGCREAVTDHVQSCYCLFIQNICIWPDSTGIFFFLRERNKSIKDPFYIQRTQAFVGVRGSKKPQTTHFLLLEIVWWDHGSNWVRSSQAWSWG